MDEYRVISVEAFGKKKYKVTLEGMETFVLSLYPSEIKRYCLTEGGTLSIETYADIHNILYRRGKDRALYYLKTSDKTVSQMRTKLMEGFYPEDIANQIIDFLEGYGYLDDLRYAKNYISYNKKRKSLQRMRNDLVIKGVDKKVIEEAFYEATSENEDFAEAEEAMIEEYCRRKLKCGIDDKQLNRIMMSLMRKGFRYEQIKSVLRRVMEETTT